MKLNSEKVKLIMAMFGTLKFGTKTISKNLGIFRRRVQQIIKQYKETGRI